MRSDEGHGDVPVGPPWPVELLADLHAGVYDEEPGGVEAARRAGEDAEARAVLTALDRTRSDVAGLGATPEPVAMPADVAARLDAALAAEASPAPEPAPAPVVDLAAARRRRRNRIMGWGSGAVAVAAAVAAAVFVVVPGLRSTTPGQGVAAPPPSAGEQQAPLALGSGQLGRAALGRALGRSDLGPFTDTGKLRGCLAANGLDTPKPASSVVSSAQVTRRGEHGTLFVLTTGKKARFRLLIVGESCAAGHPATIDDTVVGPK